MAFEILNLDAAPAESIEPLGTKRKFWTTLPDRGRCLCKLARPGTGEDWSEVIAAEIASLIGLPHADYFLGEYHGEPAVVSPSFADAPDRTLILGNALLPAVDPIYNADPADYRQPTHTVDLVVRLLEGFGIGVPEGHAPDCAIQTAVGVFVGYLALDALIGNTDRHHENWGLVLRIDPSPPTVRLAPTFDHASCLGCHETEETKRKRLETRDSGFNCAA